MSERLPRGVDWMLRWLLPGDLADPIAGDLLEEFIAVRRRRSSVSAGVWVWSQAIRVTTTFWIERRTRGRPLPPIGDELKSVERMWDSLRHDIVFAVRTLRRQPGFTAVALVALALGIGANTAIFSIVDAVLWRPLPYPNADRVMSLAEQRPREGRWFGPVAPADYFDWQRDQTTFSALAAYTTQPVNRPLAYNLTSAGEPERVRAIEVSPAFLRVLGLLPALGRDFRPDEETVGRHRVVLLSDALWRRRFGGDRAIVGRTITFDASAFEVIGILPAQFWWPTRPEVVVPLALDGHDRALRAAHFLEVIGRLREGVATAQARDDLRTIGARLSKDFPTENANHFPNLRPLRDALVGDVRQALLVLLGAVTFVMLIACANVATLLLARAAGRSRELAVRRAIGATRGRLVRQMLTESVVMAIAGGAAGLLLAAWAVAAFQTMVPAQFSGLPGIAGVAIDTRVLVAAFGLSAVTGIIFGVVPALAASETRMGASLTAETRGSGGSAHASQLRAALIVTELALSLVLLAGAGLLIVSFRNVINVSPGFESAQLVTAPITLPSSRYGTHARATAFFERVYDRLRSAPGIQRVAATSSLPFAGADSRLDLQIEHRIPDTAGPVRAHPRLVSPDYFATMGIRIRGGRPFTERDREESGDVAIVNEAAVRRYWSGADPIGQRISLGAPSDWREVVGVVSDTRQDRLDADVEPAAYLPQAQTFASLGTGLERSMTIVVRTAADTAGAAAAIRSAVARIDPQLPLGAMRTMTQLIDDSVAPQRLNFMLVSAFAALAVLLTAAGLYGVMAYIVAQRTREIGVRMALGASPPAVLLMILREAGAMTAAGIAVGLGGALMLSRFLATLLFGVSATDPLVYAAVAALLGAVALVAVVGPALRATRVDPLVALRDS